MFSIDNREKLKKQSGYASATTKIALLFATYTVVIALLFLYYRQGDAEITRQVTGIISYPLALFGLVALSSHLWKNLWVLPICVLAFMLLPFAISPIGVWFLLPVAIFGIVSIVYSCWLIKIFKSIYEFIWVLATGIFLAVFYFLVVNGMNYAHLFSDIAAYTNFLHRDTLFHSAIINMIARFGIPSTGLDGVVPLAYHVGIHRWVAANSLILGGETPMLLGITQQIALLPAFFFVTVLTVYHLSAGQVSVLTIVGVTFGLIWLEGIGGWKSYLVSESYTFSLLLFTAMLPVGANWLDISISNRLFQVVKPWHLVITLPAIAACWSAKMSTGLILIIYLIACILIPQFLRNPKQFLYPILFLFSIGCLGLAATMYFYVNLSIFEFFPFHFALFYSQQFIWGIFIFVVSITLIYLFISQEKEKEFRKLLSGVLTVTFLVGQVPGALLEIGGGSAFYFVHPVLMMSLIFCSSAIIDTFCSGNLKKNQLITIYFNDQHTINSLFSANPENKFHKYFIYTLLIGFLLICLIGSSAPNLIRFGNLLIKIDKIAQPQVETISSKGIVRRGQDAIKLLILPSPPNKESLLSNRHLFQIKQSIANLNMARTEQNTVVYIPPSSQAFWKPEKNAARTCWDLPLVVPAMIGLPLLNGVRSGLENCEVTPYYGMADYGSESLNQELSQQELCTKAQKLGFSQVYKISENSHEFYRCQS